MPPPRLSARRLSHDRGYIRHGAAGRAFRSGGWLRHHERSFHQYRQPARLGDEIPFGISAADQRHHLYLIGKSGSGKTTLLRNLIVQHIAAGHGVGLIDPHGDLAEELLDCICHRPSALPCGLPAAGYLAPLGSPCRADDLVYLHPGDRDFPIGFNHFATVPPDEWHLVARSHAGA